MSAGSEIVPLLNLPIRTEADIVTCRQHAREFSVALGFDHQSQTRIATAVSEIARNAYQYARGGHAEFSAETETNGNRRHDLRQQSLVITIRDEGPGIGDLDSILSGNYRSSTGMGLGIVGAHRLMDAVHIDSKSGGSVVTLRKNLPPSVQRKTARQLQEMAVTRSPRQPDMVVEVRKQNQELLSVMEEVRHRQEQLSQVNKELEETNAGVLALYDELETLHRVGLLLASKMDLQAVIQALIEATTDLTYAQFGGCYMLSELDARWQLYAVAGPHPDYLNQTPTTNGSDFFGADFGAGSLIHIGDLHDHPDDCCVSQFAQSLKHHVQLRSCLAVPLVSVENKVLGALVFGSSEPRIFSERSERIVSSIAAQAIVAIDKARLFDSVKAASEAKDKFLAMISHELRTPLSPVLSIVSNLSRDTSLPPEVLEDIAVVLRNVQLEARLIDDLLDFHRIIKGNLNFAAEVTDVHAVILNVIEICRADLKERSQTLVLRLEAPRYCVLGDPARLQQVFWNVLKNSNKFTPSGGTITITTAVEAEGTLLIEISDTGRGIEPHLLSGIFGAFEQGSVEGITQFGGLGLGLAIVKAFVEKHQGTVAAESRGRGHGAKIVLRLPLTDQRLPSAHSEAPAADAGPSPSGSGRILLVEDHHDTLWSLARLLTRAGYVVVTATTCADALRLVGSESFDLLISDLGLPDGTGIDLVKSVRTQSPIPAIALSGYGMENDVTQTREAGFDVHLTKPVAFQVLRGSIETLLGSRTPPVG